MPPHSEPSEPSIRSPRSGSAERLVAIGWKEYLDLPEMGITGLKAKVDTGARTSSLHVDGLRVVERHADGTAVVEFEVPLHRRDPSRSVHARARMLREVRVTDSGGSSEVRPVIETVLALGPVRKRILLTLTDRTGMLFRMLLGRKALEGDFVVDVASRYLTGNRPRSRKASPRGSAPTAAAPGSAVKAGSGAGSGTGNEDRA